MPAERQSPSEVVGAEESRPCCSGGVNCILKNEQQSAHKEGKDERAPWGYVGGPVEALI